MKRDHPRVRGEKQHKPVFPSRRWGSPPRARGKVGGVQVHPGGGGITPACAGKSAQRPHGSRSGKDHPRVRGEKLSAVHGITPKLGSPPRARGKGRPLADRTLHQRITPACAGKRSCHPPCGCGCRDHPRVRGEKLGLGIQIDAWEGSPPRARGKVAVSSPRADSRRITPACAGKSKYCRHQLPVVKDHPRVRGEKRWRALCLCATPGSPPRARGKV